MAFLTKDELKTHGHVEIIDAITRSDDTIIDMLIEENISYMKGYLNSRYDVKSVFEATGDHRNKVVLKLLKALVIYDVYNSHNPQHISDNLREERDRAVEWLKMVQKQEVNPDLPTLDTDEQYLQFGSNVKRTQHY